MSWGVYTLHLKLNQTHWYRLKLIVFHYYCHSGSFYTYLFDCFIKSLIWYQFKWGGRGCQSTWTPCALYVWKMSIFGLLYGLDLFSISWSFVTMCAYHVSSGIFYGDFIITCLWKYLKNWTWHFMMSTYMLRLLWILCNFSWKWLVYVIMTKGLHLIPIDFITCHLKTVSKNCSIFHYEESWWYLVRFTMNIIFKMSDFSDLLLLLQLKDNGVSNAFWN